MLENFEKEELEQEDDASVTPEEKREAYRKYENDILGGLMAAANYKKGDDQCKKVEIVRGGEVCFTFRVRPLGEDEYRKSLERNTKYVKNKAVGIRVPEKTDQTRYRSELIYRATVPEDQAKLWDNHAAQVQLDVVTGIDLIDKVLMAGEKNAVCELLDEISGYDSSLEETAKN